MLKLELYAVVFTLFWEAKPRLLVIVKCHSDTCCMYLGMDAIMDDRYVDWMFHLIIAVLLIIVDVPYCLDVPYTWHGAIYLNALVEYLYYCYVFILLGVSSHVFV